MTTFTTILAFILWTVSPILGQEDAFFNFSSFNGTTDADFDEVADFNDAVDEFDIPSMMDDGTSFPEITSTVPTEVATSAPQLVVEGEVVFDTVATEVPVETPVPVEGEGEGEVIAESTVGPSEVIETNVAMDATFVPTENEVLDAITTPTPTTEAPADVEEQTTGASVPLTNAPAELDTTGFTCSVGGVETDTARCTEYKKSVPDVSCGCFYFCEGGTLVKCMDDTQTSEFSCGGEDDIVYECYESPADATSSAVDGKYALQALMTTGVTALAAHICIA